MKILGSTNCCCLKVPNPQCLHDFTIVAHNPLSLHTYELEKNLGFTKRDFQKNKTENEKGNRERT